MWKEHLGLLACPACRGGLGTTATDPWLSEATLNCEGCGATYPVVRGVARLWVEPSRRDPGPHADPRTRASFGYEWLRYPVTTFGEDLVTLVGLTGVEPRFYDQVAVRNLFSHQPSEEDVEAATTAAFVGRRVLEAGCGMGKYVRVVAGLDAAVAVGLDASDAVERAVQVTRELRNALIVQGDIFHPPLQPEFDLAYSVGVLHHTPDARQAFLRVAELVQPGGEMAVWLYPHARDLPRQLIEIWHERILRPLTSRLPLPVLERLCALLGRMTALKTRLAERGPLWRRTVVPALNLVAVGQHLDPHIAAFLNFDWYSPRYRSRHLEEELAGWFDEAGFSEPRSLPERVSGIARKRT